MEFLKLEDYLKRRFFNVQIQISGILSQEVGPS